MSYRPRKNLWIEKAYLCQTYDQDFKAKFVLGIGVGANKIGVGAHFGWC